MKAFFSLFALLLSVTFVSAQDFEYSFSETYKVSSPAGLRIGTSDGNIDVRSSSGNEIQVYYIARKNGRLLKIDREELEKEVALEVDHDNNTLEITVKHNMTDSWWSLNRVNVGFRIYVPIETAAVLHTSDGNISLDGLISNQECKTSDGNISIKNIKGRTTGITSDGNISISAINGSVMVKTSDGNISLEQITGDVESHTSDGNIGLNVVQGDVDAVTSDGSIRLNRITGEASARTSDGHISFEDLSGSLTAITSDGNIYGNIIHLGNKLSARTSGGNVDITIPGQLGLDLDIRGENINVPLVNFSGRSDKRTIHGQCNGGGILVNIEASDGNVNLAYK